MSVYILGIAMGKVLKRELRDSVEYAE